MIRLAKGRERRIEAGHPWVYRTEIADIKEKPAPGDIVDVVTYRGRFLGRGYYNPASMITARILTRHRQEIDEEFFRRRIEAAWGFRKEIMHNADSDAFRVVFGESDGLPGLIVDKFGDYLVIQTLALGIDRYKDIIAESLDELIKPKVIYERNDATVRSLEGLDLRKGALKGDLFADTPVIINENGIRLMVDIVNGQKTGYFLDQRENRAAIQDYVRNARVLDCFCYSGSFSLHAARYGAREVIGIDVSKNAVELAAQNAALNGFERCCSFLEGNVFDELRALDRAREIFDVVILDPPAFAKSRSALEGAVRGYKEINLRAMRILREGGFLITCSCSYHMPQMLFMKLVHEAALDVGRVARVVEIRGQARDHPVLMGYDESRYLKCLIIQVT